MRLSLHRAFLALGSMALCAVLSCATENKTDQETVRQTEMMLEEAGFTKIDVDVPSEDLENLPTYTLNQYPGASGTVFWYYDPDYCQCLFEGRQADADRYQLALDHKNDLAAYEDESEESAAQQGLMASAYGGAIPMPFLWGGYSAFPIWYGYGWGHHGGGYHGGGSAPPPGGGGGGGHHPGGGHGGHGGHSGHSGGWGGVSHGGGGHSGGGHH